jgi:membrane-associated protease RseP (regulator of RpoE activity)
MITALVLLLAAIAIATAVHLAGMLATALLLRVPIEIVSFGVGPTLATLGLGGRAQLLVKLIPLAGSVTFVPADELPGGQGFEDLNRFQKIAAALSGSIACVLVACLLLGPHTTLREMTASWGEFFRVVRAFPDVAAQWVPITEAIRANSFVVVLGLALAKVGGLNLLPLMPLNGGMALMYLLGKRFEDSAFAQGYFKVSLLVLLIVVGLWLIGAAVMIVKGV